MTEKDLLNFEQNIINLWENGDLPYLLHLSGGNEKELIDIFKNIKKEDYVFSTHRNHYHYLLHGGSPEYLKHLILKGKSMFVFDKSINFFTSSIVAGTPAIAAGVALSLKINSEQKHVWCFVGDGAEDEGHFYEAVMYVAGNNLPCTFIIEDNDRSVIASKEQRRGKINFNWPECVIRYHYQSPYPHAGNGTKKKIIFKEQFKKDIINGI